MNAFKFLTILILLTVQPVHAGETGKHLFILSGQSNMEGLQPDKSFIPAVQRHFGRDNATVIMDARRSSAIWYWYKDWNQRGVKLPADTGYLYDRLMNKVRLRLAANFNDFDTVTFVWMQGEDDARHGFGEVYAASLRGLIDQLKHDIGRDDINVVIGRISDYDMDNSEYPHWTMVREAQVEVAEALPRGAWVDTDDLNDGPSRTGEQINNALHYSKQGYITLGKRFAEKAIELIHSFDVADDDQGANSLK